MSTDLITTDILGPFNAPYAIANMGLVPGVLLYFFFGMSLPDLPLPSLTHMHSRYLGSLVWWPSVLSLYPSRFRSLPDPNLVGLVKSSFRATFIDLPPPFFPAVTWLIVFAVPSCATFVPFFKPFNSS